MKIKTTLLSVLLVLGISALAQNEDSVSDSQQVHNDNAQPETYILSLEDAKTLALEYNWDLKKAGLSIEEAHEATWEAIAQGLPQIGAKVDYTTFFGASNELELAPGASSKIEFNNTSNFNATASQLIFSGAYIVGLQTAKLYEDLITKTADKTELDVKQQVTDAYYAILLAKRTKQILEQNLENVKEVNRQTEIMYKAGVAELTDVDQLSIQVTSLESSLRTTNRQITIAYDLLKLQIGIAPTSNLKLTQTLDDFFEPENFYMALVKAFNVNENIDYQLLLQQEGMSEKQVQLAKSEYLPTLSANYNYLKQIVAPNFNMSPNHTLMFNLNIPIFSSGQRKAKVNQAKLQLEALQNDKHKLNDALIAQDRTIKLNLQTALDQYDAQKKNVDVSKRVYDNINRKYNAGMVSSLDLTTANTNYLNAESSYIQSMLDVLNAYVELEKFYSNL
ncbi:MAG: TolC family protein [Bacteroidales bacterium]